MIWPNEYIYSVDIHQHILTGAQAWHRDPSNHKAIAFEFPRWLF